MKKAPNLATVAAISTGFSVPVTRTVDISSARSMAPSVRMPAPMTGPSLPSPACSVV